MHRNARLTVLARRTLVERIDSGRAVAHVAAEMGVGQTCLQVVPPLAEGGCGRT